MNNRYHDANFLNLISPLSSELYHLNPNNFYVILENVQKFSKIFPHVNFRFPSANSSCSAGRKWKKDVSIDSKSQSSKREKEESTSILMFFLRMERAKESKGILVRKGKNHRVNRISPFFSHSAME